MIVAAHINSHGRSNWRHRTYKAGWNNTSLRYHNSFYGRNWTFYRGDEKFTNPVLTIVLREVRV